MQNNVKSNSQMPSVCSDTLKTSLSCHMPDNMHTHIDVGSLFVALLMFYSKKYVSVGIPRRIDLFCAEIFLTALSKIYTSSIFLKP